MCDLHHPYLGNDDFQLNLEVAISMIFKISVLTCDCKHLPMKEGSPGLVVIRGGD